MVRNAMLIPKAGHLVACDTETTGLNPWKGDRPFAFSFCDSKGDTAFARFKVNPFNREVEYTSREFVDMKKFYENIFITKVFHNAKFDVRMLEQIGIKVCGKVHDTMIAMHCLRTAEPSLGLKPLAERYLGIPTDDEDDLQKSTLKARREAKKKGWMIANDETHGKNNAHADYWLADPALLRTYAVRDVERTMPLWLLLEEQLKEEGLWEVYLEEMKLFHVVYRMESRGVRVDPKVLDSEIKRNQEILTGAGARIQRLCPGINVNSPKQMVEYLFVKKKYPIARYTCKCVPGQTCSEKNHGLNPATGTEVLMGIEDPLCKLVVEFKTAEKAINGFFGRFKKLMVKEKDGYILHPDFHQVGPVTGRFSCREPNLQNVADPYGTRAPIPIPARMAFVPREGYEWWHFDYKQMELWLFSSPKIADEKKMLSVLLSGEDLPSSVAIEMGWKDQLENDKKIGRGVTRIRVKLMLYGIVYGIGANGLAFLNKIPYQEAKDDLRRFKQKYPNIDRYMEDTVRKAALHGYIQGPLGRRFQTSSNAAYKAANYIVQGSAAQVVKKAMIDSDAYLRKNKIDGHLIMTIHDELAFEIRKDQANMKNIVGLKNVMESYGKLFGIPKLPTDAERVRKNWMEKEEIAL